MPVEIPQQQGGLTYDDLIKPPVFSAFYPGAVRAGKPYAMMVFAHLEIMMDIVRDIAAGYSGLMGGQPKSTSAASVVTVDLGQMITFVPQIPGLVFDPPEQTLAWRPPHQNATFLFTVPETVESDFVGRVLVYQGVMIIGEIPVTLRLNAASASDALASAGEFTRLDPVFASYSHRDTPVMEHFRRARQHSGQKMLVDIYDLRAGEIWANRLLEMIDESAVFQLFWSDHSAASQYCREEWEHALTLLPQRPRFIQPVWWEAPMPSPPPELANLHFQRIGLPPVTRLQMVVSGLRRWLGWEG